MIPKEAEMAMSSLRGAAQASELMRTINATSRAGKGRPQELLSEECRLNPSNVDAWLCRASMADTLDEAETYLRHVLIINPSNKTAIKWLAESGRAAPDPAMASECPFCDFRAGLDASSCVNCRAILALDIDHLSTHSGCDEGQVREAIARLELLDQGLFEVQYYLAVAYLNLKESGRATRHLRKATALAEDRSLLTGELNKLLARPIVMIVDDSLFLLRDVTEALEANGIRSFAVSDPVEALLVLEEELWDVICLHITNPELDSPQLFRKIKENPATAHTPVIILSEEEESMVGRLRALFSGGSEYLNGAFNSEAFLRTVNKHLKRVPNAAGRGR
jgi:CheY-like chemotaxis protein